MVHNHLHSNSEHSSLLILIIIIVGILIIISFFIYRSLKNSKEKISFTDKQKETISNFQESVKMMLSEYGKDLKQKDISKNLDLPEDIVAEKLLEMEDAGLIERVWDNDEISYIVLKND